MSTFQEHCQNRKRFILKVNLIKEQTPDLSNTVDTIVVDYTTDENGNGNGNGKSLLKNKWIFA